MAIRFVNDKNSDESINTLFEVVPPVVGDQKDRFSRHCDYLSELFDRVEVSALNIPEINNESGKSEKGKRRNPYKERVSPRHYARDLSEEFDTDFVINRVIVKESGLDQEQWLLDTYHKYHIDNVILVGGESSKDTYPGPSVMEGNELGKKYLNQGKRRYNSRGKAERTALSIGNISIPTRRRSDLDEPLRMLQKVQTGADFFTTQIITEADYAEALMKDFSSVLYKNKASSPLIFWSFTPISEQKDIDFLRWLGVYIPDEVEDKIISSSNPSQASIENMLSIWERLQNVNDELPVRLPLGINISVMGLRNFRNGIELAEALQMVEA